jgi:hypothetical protein
MSVYGESETFDDLLKNNEPFLVRRSTPVPGNVVSHVSSKMKQFCEEADKHINYKKTGRVAKQMTTNDKCLQDFIKPFVYKDQDTVLAKMLPAEKTYIESPWTYAFDSTMKCAGAEFCFLSCAKLQVSGNRLVVAAQYDEVQEYHASTQAPTATPSYDEVLQFFSTLTTDMQDVFTKIKFHAMVVVPNDVLIMPAGYLVAEKTLNGLTNTGLRWMMVTRNTHPSFKALKKVVIPKEPRLIKPGSAASLLVKIDKAIEGQPPAKRVKAEAKSAALKET